MVWDFCSLQCILLTSVVYLTYLIFVKPFGYWKSIGVPQYGLLKIWTETFNSIVSARPLPDTVKMIYNAYPDKRYFGVYYFGQHILMLKDPELIKQVTVKNFDHFTDHKDFLPADSEWIWQKNMFVLKGDNWRDMRTTLNPFFTTNKLKTMFGLMSDCINQFVDYFQEQKFSTLSLEAKSAFERLTNDIIATTAFGITCNSMKDQNNDFYAMGKAITSFSGIWTNLNIVLIMLLPSSISKALGLKVFPPKPVDFFSKLIKANIDAREKQGIVRPDMMNLLLEARRNLEVLHVEEEQDNDTKFATLSDEQITLKKGKMKKQLTDDDILAQAMLFFFAGFDSVSTVMSFLAYELALNPEIQDRVFREIKDTLRNGELSYESLTKMKYFDMVVSEILRRHPAGFLVDRMCTKTFTIKAEREEEKDVHLKVGDTVWIPIIGFHSDPKYFVNPDRFDPERFSDENKDDIASYTYLGFGSGPRHCIGCRFGVMEIKLTFFHLLSKFELVVVEKTPIPMVLENSQMKMVAKDGFWVGLKSRNNE